MNDEIKTLVSTVLTEELNCDPAAVSDEAVLGNAGLGLESLDLLHLIYILSDEYHIRIPDDLGPYWEMSVRGLATYVASLVADR